MIPGSGRSPGEGNGNPLQYSCLENPMDVVAWRATVHGLTMSRTCLSDLHILTINRSTNDRNPEVKVRRGPRKSRKLISFTDKLLLSHSVVSDSQQPKDSSLPGSSVHGPFQARIMEWVAIPFFKGSS